MNGKWVGLLLFLFIGMTVFVVWEPTPSTHEGTVIDKKIKVNHLCFGESTLCKKKTLTVKIERDDKKATFVVPSNDYRSIRIHSYIVFNNNNEMESLYLAQ